MLKHFGSTNYWVVAEIAKVGEKNGHHYLELVDSVETKTTALMSATLWAGTYKNIRTKIGNEVDAILKPGNKVLFSMRIEFHKIYGLKLNVMDIDATYSHGEVERQKQETIVRLKAEGVFDFQKALYLSVLSKRIALIGSPGTAGFRDFKSKLETNSVYTNFTIKTFSASVQGDKATEELIKALQEARTYDVDAIIIVRGGGSKMDLNVFNNYDLAKEICLTNIPVITGIGHEHDEVVADLVCRKMCITPTAAAEFLYIQIGTFSAKVLQGFEAVLNHSLNALGGAKDEFNYVQKYLVHHSQQFLLEYQWGLNAKSHQAQKAFLQALQNEKGTLDLKLDQVKSQALNSVHLAKTADLLHKIDRLKISGTNYLTQRKNELNNINDVLGMLDPQRLLESGYTISTVDDQDLNKIITLKAGALMKTLTSKQLIISEIKSIKKT